MSTLLRDLQYAIRTQKQSPGTTAVILLALALGVGVNTSCFISVNAIVLHPLPYADIGRMLTVWEAPANVHSERGPASAANYLDWKATARSFQNLAAFQSWDANLSGVGDPERLEAYRVTADFFPVLGMKPLLGRVFRADEEESSAHVAVVSHGFWTRRMAAARDAVGRNVSLNGEAYTVVGVMPYDFNLPLETEVWAPLSLTIAQRNDRESHNLAVLGRVKATVGVDQARAEMATIGKRLAAAHPDTNENRDVVAIPILELTNNVTDRFTVMLLATAGFVLLLACANVANLLLVRLANRQKEIAVRMALGASKVRIVRQLLTESVLLALAAGGLGLLLAAWNQKIMTASIPPQIMKFVAGLRNMRFDGTVILFSLAVSLAAALLCVAPALFHSLRGGVPGLNEALKQSGRSGTAGKQRSRLRTTLAAGEVALALVLLVGAGLMVRTFQSFLVANPGFRTDHLLTMQVALPATRYAAPVQISSFYDQLLGNLEKLPQARVASLAGELGAAQAVYIEGRPDPRPGEPPPYIHTVTGEYFRTLELPLVKGRAISARDGRDSQPVVVISDVVARHYWPGSDPIGRRIRLHKTDPNWLTVVGVSGDVKEWFSRQPIPTVYLSFLQTPRANVSVLIRTATDPMQAAAPVRAEVWKVDRSQPVFDMKSMDDHITEQTSGVRAAAVTMASYAVISLFLAVMGIYAVISYSVTQRTHEIGIRMALGADRKSVVGMTFSEAIRVGGIGLAIGVPVSLGLMQLMTSVLYGVIQPEPAMFIGMAAMMAVAAMLAGYLPARRAAQVDPVTALRSE